MYQKCRNLSEKVKDGKLVMYCKKKRETVEYSCHISCSDVEYKKYKQLKAKKRIKPVSNHKNVVSDDTYYYCLERDNDTCQLCEIMGFIYNDNDGKIRTTLSLHHIVYRSENINLIDEPTNCIFLCNNCHEKVHSNKKYWQPILMKIIKKNKFGG